MQETQGQNLAVVKNPEIEAVLETLERELVGLRPVKQRIREIAAYLSVDKLRRELGLTADRPTLHMAFVGPPGTG